MKPYGDRMETVSPGYGRHTVHHTVLIRSSFSEADLTVPHTVHHTVSIRSHIPPLDLTVHHTVSIRSTIRSFFVVLYGPHTVSYGLHTVGHTVPRTVPRHSVQIGVPYGPHTVPIRFPYAFHRGSYGFHTVPIRFHTVFIRSPYPRPLEGLRSPQ